MGTQYHVTCQFLAVVSPQKSFSRKHISRFIDNTLLNFNLNHSFLHPIKNSVKTKVIKVFKGLQCLIPLG